jgi:integrase
VRPTGTNPCRLVRRYKAQTNQEAKQRLRAFCIIRLLLVTGARLNDLARLRCSEVDLERGWFDLADTKTGRSSRPLNTHAIAILEEQRRLTPEGDWVVPGRLESGPVQDLFVTAHHLWRQGGRLKFPSSFP